MQFSLKMLMWAGVLAMFCCLSSSAFAQQCSRVCKPNVSCDTECFVGRPTPDNGTTCGDAGFDCCSGPQEISRSTYCTAQKINVNTRCVYLDRELVTDQDCSGRTTTHLEDFKHKGPPGATPDTCPTFATPGCEDFL